MSWGMFSALRVVLPENTYCLIFLTFFRGTVNLVPSVIVRIQNHEAVHGEFLIESRYAA